MATEIEIVRRAQAGDQGALGELVVQYQTYVYSIALGVMHQPADAADMTQEAFVRLMRSIRTYRGDTRFTTWLYRLVTNICLDELRRRKGVVESLNTGWADGDESPASALPDRDRWGQPEESLQLREASSEVREALGQLPTMQRLALTLYYFGDLQDREIGEVMGLPVNTVKSHIHRGKARMALLLGARLGRPAAAARPVLVPEASSGWSRGLGTRVAQSRPLMAAARAA
jgi:RNA polymerase sigma-70 factor (ECF subfamily)